MSRAFICIVLFVVIAVSSVTATTIHVPADTATIQGGIDMAVNGDTVLVAEGHYYERINFNSKSILLTSEFMLDGDTLHIQNTIIDADTLVLGVADTGSVVCFVNGEDSTSVIQGFTIQKGIGTIEFETYRRGGGIYCSSSDPTISNNTISNNSISENVSSRNYGGGIYCRFHSSPTINNNTIAENSALSYLSYSGGIYFRYSSSTISNNMITGNSAVIGGGISCENIYSITLANNTITGNSAEWYGGGIFCRNRNPIVVNTILWANIANFGGNEIYIDSDSSIIINYSDIQGGWEGEGNIDCDPMFCNLDDNNYYLAENSCCLGAGEGGIDIGALGVGCSGYPYLMGDANMSLGLWPPSVIGSDVTYMSHFFMGMYNPPCLIYGFWASADINGDCMIIGSDAVKLVRYFKGKDVISFCPAYPPLWSSSG